MTAQNEVNYRCMRSEDYAQARFLWENTPGMGLDPQMDSEDGICAYLRKNPALSFIAYVNSDQSCTCNGAAEKIIGTILCGTDGRRGYLMHLAVEGAYRRRGLGRQLVDCALAALERAGISKVHVFVFKCNDEGAKFWRANGWQGRDDLQMLSREVKCGEAGCDCDNSCC